MGKKIVILAIESSCDDTGAAIIIDGKVLSNCIASQDIHEKYGGVIPEVASRQHLQNIVPVVDAAILQAGISLQDISAVAFTRGPGLLGSLLVGVSFAKSMALGLRVPVIEVHHMQAHVLAHFASDEHPSFPFLCLTVSGGHTQILLVEDYLQMTILGQTIDDAAGEAFDKVGKLLGLTYPAGPQIDQLAQSGNHIFTFPIPKMGGLDFSFSGFKTSVLYFLQKQMKINPAFIQENLENICASVQNTIVTILVKKMEIALQQYNVKDIAISGGVSANSGLRLAMTTLAHRYQRQIFIPPLEYCTDNAAMIGINAYYKYKEGLFSSLSVAPDPRLSM